MVVGKSSSGTPKERSQVSHPLTALPDPPMTAILTSLAGYCPGILNRSPSEDSSVLSKHTRIASLAVAVQCTMSVASQFMKPPNASTFNRSLGASTKEALRNLNNGITVEDVLAYLGLPSPEGTTIINIEKPGSGDAFSLYLAEAVQKTGVAVAFQRGGMLGFGVLAGRLPTEIFNSVGGACNQYHW